MDADKQQKMLELFSEYQQSFASLDAETKRNVDNIDIFEAMIREAIPGVIMVAAGHHIMFTREGSSIPGEFASADTLIFNHDVARVVWGDNFASILISLAGDPVSTRDLHLRGLWEKRNV